MIFVTTGTQEPFDRLLKIIDGIAATIDEEIVVQAFSDQYKSVNVGVRSFLSPSEFDSIMKRCRLVVAHAGMGTIISAMQAEKPIVIFPRIAAMGEHRNEHQLATANRLTDLGYVYRADDADTLLTYINTVNLPPLKKLNDSPSPKLIKSITDFIG